MDGITLIILFFIASIFYTNPDTTLVLYGFGLMGLLTFILIVLIATNIKEIKDGYFNSKFGKWAIENYPSNGKWIQYGFGGLLILFLSLAFKMIIQAVRQLILRSDKVKSNNLNLSNKSKETLIYFKNTYYTFVFVLIALLYSFTKSVTMDTAYPFFKYFQLMLFIVLFVTFFMFSDLFIKGEFVKIKNDGIKPKPDKPVNSKDSAPYVTSIINQNMINRLV